MIYIKCNQPTYFDIDDTLLIFNNVNSKTKNAIPVRNGNLVVWAKPHKKHIERLKQFKARNFTIIAWSAGGSAWAKRAISLLKLTEYVDLIIAKPTWFVDDKKSREFMPEVNRIYYKDEEI